MEFEPVHARALAQSRVDVTVGADDAKREFRCYRDVPARNLEQGHDIVYSSEPVERLVSRQEVAGVFGRHAVAEVGRGLESVRQQEPSGLVVGCGVSVEFDEASTGEERDGRVRFPEKRGDVAIVKRQPRQCHLLFLSEGGPVVAVGRIVEGSRQ